MCICMCVAEEYLIYKYNDLYIRTCIMELPR